MRRAPEERSEVVVAVDIVGADVWGASEQVNHVAMLEPLGQIDVKGRSEPVLAYRLVGPNEPGA